MIIHEVLQGTILDRYNSRIGERIGLLRFEAICGRGDNNRVMGMFSCECGKVVQLPAGRVLNGKKRLHCGCKIDRHAPKTHGMRYTPEYSSWRAMKSRCLDPNNKDYPRWGGVGITVCQEWVESFEAFYRHIGSRSSGTSLDRVDTTKSYEPGNVRWATASEQQRNRRTAYRWHIKGKIFETNEEAAQFFGVSDHTVWRWVNGQFDKRRNRFTPPLKDCTCDLRYDPC